MYTTCFFFFFNYLAFGKPKWLKPPRHFVTTLKFDCCVKSLFIYTSEFDLFFIGLTNILIVRSAKYPEGRLIFVIQFILFR